jgi:hypothetical protein
VTSARPKPISDDHGDQFPGALPAPTTPASSRETGDRLVRMHPAYVQKVNPVVEAGREGLAHELAQIFAEESSGGSATGARVGSASGRRGTGRPTPIRGSSSRPPGQATTRLGTVGRFTRSSIERFDRYTLEVFNAGSPYRSRDDR